MSRRRRIRAVLGVPSRRFAGALVLTGLIAALVLVVLDQGFFEASMRASAIARDALERYGLFALLAVFVLEGLMILYFAPSESLVPAAILTLGDGPVTLLAILAVAVLGATAGQVGLFLVARRAGRDYVLERGWLGLTEAQLDRFDDWFERWGPLAVPVSNAMLFVRGMVTVPAGLSDMDVRTFAVLSALGTLAFEVVLAAVTLGLIGAL